VELASDEGATGWGEAAPLPGFSRESLDEVSGQLSHLAGSLVGYETTVDPEGAFARELDTELVTSRPRATVPVNALISSPDSAVEETFRARACGYEAVKLKVGGQGVEEDVELVRPLSETLGGDVSLRLDANRVWSSEEPERFARGTADLRLEYVEEPLSDPAGLSHLASTCGLPVALDESLADIKPEALEDHGYARAVVLKPTLLGGISRTLRFARLAARLGDRHRDLLPGGPRRRGGRRGRAGGAGHVPQARRRRPQSASGAGGAPRGRPGADRCAARDRAPPAASGSMR
jgi:o-succinylbenzoate synthase